jgi:hypothetical protein
LTADDIQAAQAFAADCLADEELVYGKSGVRWLVDECVDAGLAALLPRIGSRRGLHADVAPRAPDLEVMNRADRENSYC